VKFRALALASALSAVSGTAAAFPVTELQQAGPVAQRFNVAILGDGYRAEDQTKLTSDARTLVNALFDSEPYKPYRQLFNFKVIQTVSVDRGAKGGAAGGTPDTIFGAYYNCEDVPQLVCMNDSAVLAAAAADMPEFNLAVVIVNDSKYGGAGGSVPCVSTDEGAAEILRHELGHTLGNLADEYQNPYPGYPPCSASQDCTEPNVTLRSVRSQIKWLDWIDDSTPVPTPEGTKLVGVGLFEGARYMATGVYRPVDTLCKMQTLGSPFCPVCSEALVRAFWNLENVHLIDRALPASRESETKCVDAVFAVETPNISSGSLTFSWTVDGDPIASDGPALTIVPGTLSEGAHQIAVTVKDATPLVRNDPQGALTESHSFAFNAPACESMPMAGNGGGGSGGSSGEANGSGGRSDAGGAGGGMATAGHGAEAFGGSSGSPSAGAGNVEIPSGMKPPPPKQRMSCDCRLGPSPDSARPLGFVAVLGLAALFRRRALRVAC